MYSNLAPPQPLPITLVTDHLVIEGIARTRRQRITDLLNDAETQGLIVLEATFTDHASGHVVARGDVAQVPLDQVLFAYARVETAGAPEMRMARKATRALLLAGPFSIEGLIHLPLEPDLKIALEEFQGRFIAVTNARYCVPGKKARAWTDVDLLVVNHGRTYVSVSADGVVDEGPVDPLAPVSGSGW